MEIKRNIFSSLAEEITQPEISILIGPRQVGKTFLLNLLEKKCKKEGLTTSYYNLEDFNDMEFFSREQKEIFNSLIKTGGTIFIDEFHYLKNISALFKALFDAKKKLKIFASGSSSIEIHRHLKESLAGRKLVTTIFPLTYSEFKAVFKEETQDSFTEFLKWGGLPGIFLKTAPKEKMRGLIEILEAYLLKDIKSLLNDENLLTFRNLLYKLAEKQGSEVSLNALSSDLKISLKALTKMLEIVKGTFVLFEVPSFSKNVSNELKKSKKYYLYDTGIRNAILKDFSDWSERADKGILSETFVLHELVKNKKPNEDIFFWRTKDGAEVDFILYRNRQAIPIEVKSILEKVAIPTGLMSFLKRYPETKEAYVFNLDKEEEIKFNGVVVKFRGFEEGVLSEIST